MDSGGDKELWLVWQNSKTRLRHNIGRLWTENGKYFFQYDQQGLSSAKKYGYQLHPSFPGIEVYKSNKLFPAFALRLPNTDRPDYKNILSKYGLSNISSDFDILAKTGGKLATDNYEFVEALHKCDNLGLDHEFYIAGWRYWVGPNLPPEKLMPGTILKITPELENKYDRFALQVETNDGAKIGYIPAFYSKIIYHYIAQECNCELKVTDFNPQRESSKVLLVRLICDMKCK
ncbi:HIRAN domain-containing protein [Desulfolucanica intricata]|uniref:HIRAN domain-containing protein n=1 Tax=Desulfolucanica intricata TaxID=1285191 RepID=UPI00082BE7B3|nr:HIRAN domain-containing protein [Desulfolucanica intricata]